MPLSRVLLQLSWSYFKHGKMLRCVPGAFSSPASNTQHVSIAEVLQPCDQLGGPSVDFLTVFLMLGAPELEEHMRENT